MSSSRARGLKKEMDAHQTGILQSKVHKLQDCAVRTESLMNLAWEWNLQSAVVLLCWEFSNIFGLLISFCTSVVLLSLPSIM